MSRDWSHMNWDSIRNDTILLLQDLIRFDTTNPPGNETPCVEYIASLLRRDGFEPTVLESAPGRGNVIARIKGDGTLPPLLLMGHVDVVTAEADKWREPPFSGHYVDGIVWGRGATDMKQMVAMELMTLLLLKQENTRLKRDVIFMATADEETGGKMGAGFIAAHHPELIRAEYALNEGGATSIELDGKMFFVCSTAEKGSARFTLRGRGQPGHASQPHQNNAILPLARAVTRLIENPLPIRITETAREHVEALAREVDHALSATLRELLEPATHDRALQMLPLAEPVKRRMSAAFRNTATPTILRAGSKINVIPAEAECAVDCRILPGTSLDTLEPELRAILGDEIEIEFGGVAPALESSPNSPLFETIQRAIARHANNSPVIPGLITGGTDAKSVVPLGIKVYGFVPQRYEGPDMAGLAHAHNERVSAANLEFGTRVLYDVVREFCAGQ
jgi:acetylornithine deacetylase/succinyl-diaminopimelate desuccinylase-like protein